MHLIYIYAFNKMMKSTPSLFNNKFKKLSEDSLFVFKVLKDLKITKEMFLQLKFADQLLG